MGKRKSTVKLIFSGFYFVAGIIMLVLLIWSGGNLPHVGLLGILSIIASYGLNKMKRWALFLLTILLFMGITFGAVMIYAFNQWFGQDLTIMSIEAVIVAYMALLTTSFLDALSKRKKFV